MPLVQLGLKLTKWCKGCQTEKILSDFYQYGGKAQTYCKPCSRSRSKKYHKDNYVKMMLLRASNRARKSGVPFNLTSFDIYIPPKCPVLGIPLVQDASNLDNAPSLDRIRPELGYVSGNVQVISNRANRLKSDGSPDELMKVACYMIEGVPSEV